MSKAYSNKALPRGTILREWRLEEVLGVGGFGIVYKARGIYFNELVAIKEYFPSAISERDEDATVVPVDSDAEEVHALGLKKFVEEAKLLWNLSSPSRHPNIVSVRSLFEIHGTAYMVMDFEDGTSLSKLLKNGVRFNESSLKDMIVPMAEGLERAHRVGVLHRDIKPPNIILNDSGKSVLIDFGSARFESGEATSTTVTFHTPPYAAIEQYVKTFEQGPWTDIYALGVVLYECVTGTKPPEVLERMHGTAGAPLSEGNWPGYSKAFLAAIDKAMMVRPEDRPRSISDWLPMLVAADSGADEEDDFDQDVTRIMSFDAAAKKIMPVAPPPPGFGTGDMPVTNVPDDPSEAQFKAAGGTTNVGKRASSKQEALKGRTPAQDNAAPAPAPAPAPAEVAPVPSDADKAKTKSPGAEAGVASAIAAASPIPAGENEPKAGKADEGAPQPVKAAVAARQAGGSRGKLLMAAGAAVLVAGAGVGWMMLGSDTSEPLPLASSTASPMAVVPLELEALAPELTQLAADARQAGIDNQAVTALIDQAAQIKSDTEQLDTLPAGAEATALSSRISQAATKAGADFTAALLSMAERQVAAALRTYPWANPARSGAALSPSQRQAAQRVQGGLSSLRASGTAASGATEPQVAIAGARQALTQFGTLRTAIAGLANASATAGSPAAQPSIGPTAAGQTSAPATAASQTAAPASMGGGSPITTAQRRQINRIVDQANDVARDVIRLERRDRPGANATAEEREGYTIRQADAQTAREYQTYLRNLESSMANATADDGERMIQQANQTLGYLRELVNRSNATLRR